MPQSTSAIPPPLNGSELRSFGFNKAMLFAETFSENLDVNDS